MPLANLHPFQQFDLERIPSWRDFEFNKKNTERDENAANDMEAAFQRALREGSLRDFTSTYFGRAREILERYHWEPVIYEILSEAFPRMIRFYLFLRRRKRSSLAVQGSCHTWQIPLSLLIHARGLAEEMEKNGKRVSEYYALRDDPPLNRWVRENVRPVIESYVGSRAIAPHAHIRVVNTESFSNTWDYMYKDHPFGYYHWDELCHSIPLIIYLRDVSISDGPYSYIEGSDRSPQNLTIRAFAQAISCKLLITDKIDTAHKKKLAALPRIFRAGEMVGSHVDPALFTDGIVKRATGVAGTAILADGFSLVHGGGHPSGGRRSALFIAHRYPRNRLMDIWSAAARKWWQLRGPRSTAHSRLSPSRIW